MISDVGVVQLETLIVAVVQLESLVVAVVELRGIHVVQVDVTELKRCKWLLLLVCVLIFKGFLLSVLIHNSVVAVLWNVFPVNLVDLCLEFVLQLLELILFHDAYLVLHSQCKIGEHLPRLIVYFIIHSIHPKRIINIANLMSLYDGRFTCFPILFLFNKAVATPRNHWIRSKRG